MSAEEPNPEIGDYVILKTLGSGSYGKVKLAQNKVTKEFVAIKIVKKNLLETNSDMAIKIRREIALMKLLDHPHLLRLVDVCESQRHLYIIIEYAAHGELFGFLIEQQSLSFELAMRIFRQIIYGLDYLHTHSICHRDIKPENILLDANDNVKIADFGFARWMKNYIAVTSCGSPQYTSPEVISGKPYDGRQADVWSTGIVLYTLLCGRLPFDEPTVRKLLSRIKSGKFVMPEFPEDVKDLIRQMLTVDPTKRITIPQIKKHHAFRYNLPPLYKCPMPLPVPSPLPKVNFDEVSKESMDVLRALGFADDEEIKNELENSDKKSVAKEVCFMLNRCESFDTIDFSASAEAEPGSILYDPKPFPTSFTELTSPIKNQTPSSLNSYSFIERSILGDFIPSMPCMEMIVIGPFSEEVDVLMAATQQDLEQNEISYVFPDDMTLLCRGHTDFSIKAVPSGDKTRLECRLTTGSPVTFDRFCSELQSHLEQL